MSLLTDRLPETVAIGGADWPINWDYRVGIQFEQAVLAGCRDPMALLRLYYPKVPQDLNAAVERMLWFYRCGDGEAEAPGEGKPAKRTYDFDRDAEAVYTSFLQAYGIDLTRAELHWWKFRRLLAGLPVESAFMQRIYYRTADTRGMGREQRRQVEKMRALYALDGRGPDQSLEARDAWMKEYVARRFAEAARKE